MNTLSNIDYEFLDRPTRNRFFSMLTSNNPWLTQSGESINVCRDRLRQLKREHHEQSQDQEQPQDHEQSQDHEHARKSRANSPNSPTSVFNLQKEQRY